MMVYIITDSNTNTFYTGKSRKGSNSKNRKSPHFSPNQKNAKIYRQLSHARSARTYMGSGPIKMHNIDILEYELSFLRVR